MKYKHSTGMVLAGLLSSGVIFAADVTLSMPTCANFSFNSGTNVLSCAEALPEESGSGGEVVVPVCSVMVSPSSVSTGGASTISANCSNTPTSYSWVSPDTGPVMSEQNQRLTFSQAGTYTYKVRGTNENGVGSQSSGTVTVTAPATAPGPSGCITPPGTIIIAIGSSDDYAKKDFDKVFDNPGSTLDSAVAAGRAKAFAFTNNSSLEGYISATSGNYGAGYKDYSLSLCPGDFTESLGEKCLLTRKNSINLGYSTDGSQGCKIPMNQTLYFNVRGNGGAAVGFVSQNLEVARLP